MQCKNGVYDGFAVLCITLDAMFCAGTAWPMARAATQPVRHRFIGKDMQRIWTLCLDEAIQLLLVPQMMICKVYCLSHSHGSHEFSACQSPSSTCKHHWHSLTCLSLLTCWSYPTLRCQCADIAWPAFLTRAPVEAVHLYCKQICPCVLQASVGLLPVLTMRSQRFHLRRSSKTIVMLSSVIKNYYGQQPLAMLPCISVRLVISFHTSILVVSTSLCCFIQTTYRFSYTVGPRSRAVCKVAVDLEPANECCRTIPIRLQAQAGFTIL